MELRVNSTFAGALGSGTEGATIRVDDAIGKRMLADGYPVAAIASAKGRKGSSKAKSEVSADGSDRGPEQPEG